MFVRGIRGAVTVESNTSLDIISNTENLLTEIFKQNDIKKEDLVSIIFTMTSDLDAAFPAIAARQMGITDVSLLCMNELNVKNGLKKCIRVLIQVNTEKSNSDIKHIYLKDARSLRPDLNRGNS
ncbi:MAG: chorismate mutase [Clostridia bacterium]|jgi:chorismate mutase